jgi:hypothetical protein
MLPVGQHSVYELGCLSGKNIQVDEHKTRVLVVKL